MLILVSMFCCEWRTRAATSILVRMVEGASQRGPLPLPAPRRSPPSKSGVNVASPITETTARKVTHRDSVAVFV